MEEYYFSINKDNNINHEFVKSYYMRPNCEIIPINNFNIILKFEPFYKSDTNTFKKTDYLCNYTENYCFYNEYASILKNELNNNNQYISILKYKKSDWYNLYKEQKKYDN